MRGLSGVSSYPVGDGGASRLGSSAGFMSVAFQGQGTYAARHISDLPPIDEEVLRAALTRLSKSGRAAALRLGMAPITTHNGRVVCVVAGDLALRVAGQCGWQAAWRMRWRDFHAAMEAVPARDAALSGGAELSGLAAEFSARRRLSRGQAVLLPLCALLMAGGAWSMPRMTGLAGLLFISTLFLLIAALRLSSLLHVPAAKKAPPLRSGQLPTYTVIVPLYRETRVLDQLIGALMALDYPADKLDIKLVIEQADAPMRKALRERILPACFEVLTVPDVAPRTKPKALNYALAFARGELVTIYDAEDIPHPSQLRAAAAHFAAAAPDLACLQARLSWYNAGETWLTRMIAAEYAGHFDVLLPFMAARGWPFPLGGTSNHFRLSALRAAGGWDPHNVTEDADLGFRLARKGWRVSILPSVTWEEACTTPAAWCAQRARWIKGWLQTWLVHMRQPLRLVRQTGWPGVLVLQAMMGAGVLAALAHPLFVVMSLAWLLHPAPAHGLAQTAWLALGAMVLASGYVAAMAVNLLGMARRGLLSFWPQLLTLPIYWLLISAAAWLALWDFIRRPHHWRKTSHGRSAFLQGGQDAL